MKEKDKIIQAAKRLLNDAGSAGITVGQLKQDLQDVNANTINGVWHRTIRRDRKISEESIRRIGRGSFAFSKFFGDDGVDSDNSDIKTLKDESIYYAPFAEYLQDELSECDKAYPLGGSALSGPWTTPDVIGITKAERKFNSPARLVTAEIKIDTRSNSILKGFGQCCAYRLFSHKVYLVIPRSTPIKSRILDLCIKHNIGLVLFNEDKDIKDPSWDLAYPPKHEDPHYNYLEDLFNENRENKVMKEINNYIK